MTESFWLGLVVGVIATAIGMRLAPRERNVSSLTRLEAKLDALLDHEGIRFDPYANVPRAVVEALGRGEKIEAIKEYRSATGAGLKEAKEYVEEVQRRAAPRV
jgi:ribosomal protein L7/L12